MSCNINFGDNEKYACENLLDNCNNSLIKIDVSNYNCEIMRGCDIRDFTIVDDGVNPTEALVKNMNKVLKDVKGHKYAGITTNYGKVCYAYPSSFGALTSIKDLVNNINYTASFNQTTMTIDGIEYFMYLQIDPSAANNVEITFA